jgi:POT family proton-dependent oligopeptide transporter
MSHVSEAPAASPDWFGQPRGLTVLFLTEMWTQFSFFGMRAILVYYMTKQLGFPQARSSLVYGGYAAAVFFTPIFGGLIGDRLIGKRNAVITGGLLMAAGHFMMVFPGLFFPALGAIALGNGFFLPSLSSQINSLYREDDPRLASAYNVYYVGINLGAFLAPFVCGTLGEAFGWHWGFAAAGVGMLFGLAVYLAGLRYLPAEPPRGRRRAPQAPAVGRSDRRRFLFLLGVMAVVIVFRGAYEQNGNTIALWTDSGVDRHVAGGWSIPLTWFQALNPLVIFLATPILVAWWTRQARRGREPSSIRKMASGAAITALSYGLISLVVALSGEARAGWIWLALFFAVMTWGELYILPVGLGLFGRLAPRGFEATAIAIWFFAGFAGNLLAGGLGVLWSSLSPAAFFALVAGVALVSGALLLVFLPAGARAEETLKARA